MYESQRGKPKKSVHSNIINWLAQGLINTIGRKLKLIFVVHSDGRAHEWHGSGEQEPGQGDHQGGGEGRPERPHDLPQHGRV